METKNKRILLSHGSGGRLTYELITKLFKSHFSNSILNEMDDAAQLPLKEKLAFTTDSFVVNPLFFPGGDIGKLAICGTVNDLAMKGAKPLYISVAAIIEEGLEIDILERITKSIKKTAKEAGVLVVTGDTKVVEKGKADKLFLTTSGVGVIDSGINISSRKSRPEDSVIINGSIGEHGVAVLSARNEFKFKTSIKSDCSPLNRIVDKILKTCNEIHSMRDPTRGGVATSLNEIAIASNIGIIIEENLIPIKQQVKAACDLLGLDPLYMANEGKLLATVPEKHTKKVLTVMKKQKYAENSKVIGKIVNSPKGLWLRTSIGGLRPLIMLEGDQLPRIC